MNPEDIERILKGGESKEQKSEVDMAEAVLEQLFSDMPKFLKEDVKIEDMDELVDVFEGLIMTIGKLTTQQHEEGGLGINEAVATLEKIMMMRHVLKHEIKPAIIKPDTEQIDSLDNEVEEDED